MSRLPSGGQVTHPSSLISLLEIKRPLTPNPVAHFNCRSRVFVVILSEPFDISALHHIHSTNEFYYSGSFLTADLSDDRDITVRTHKSTQQVGGLTNFFLNKAVDLFTKKLIFLAIPVNTVLHGCESWALKAQHINKLQVFFHRSIRRILGINMHRVERDHIKNKHIHNFFGVADIIDEIRLRQFHWLGKLGRQPDSLPTKRLLSAWAPAARRGGAQFITLRKTYCDTLESILGEDCMKSGSGNLKEWLSLAQSPAKWKHLEFILKKTQREIQMDSGLGALAGPRNR